MINARSMMNTLAKMALARWTRDDRLLRGSICFETERFNGSRPGAAATAGEVLLNLLRVISKPRIASALTAR
ncbi:MAG: hypothetical protein WB439_06740 [Acidobacteriaceae bacterium]